MPIVYDKLKTNYVAPEEPSKINDYIDTASSHPNRAPVVGRSEAREGTVLSYFDDSRGNIDSVGHGGYQTEASQRVEDKNRVEEALDLFQSGGRIRDFFEVSSVGLQAKEGAYAGGATFVEYANGIEAASSTTAGGECVLPGTKVMTKRGEINIEDTKEDDLIFVFDFAEETFGYSPISDMLKGKPVKGWTELETEMGYKLKCSNSHLIYHPDYINCAIPINKLKVGGQLYVYKDGEIVEDLVKSIKVHNEETNVWNYELEFTHNYISDGVLSHNALPKDPATFSHSYVIRKDSDLEKGDLVKLDESNEMVKSDSKEDPGIVGILWRTLKPNKPETSFMEKQIEKWDDAKKEKYYNAHYIDSMNKVMPEEDRETKKIMCVAAIGDTRNYAHTDDEHYEDELLLGFKICNQNGDVKKGDLLCSSDVPGHLMKQPVQYTVTEFNDKNEPVYESKQVITNITVGKSMEDVTYDSDGKAESIYGYLYCG